MVLADISTDNEKEVVGHTFAAAARLSSLFWHSSFYMLRRVGTDGQDAVGRC